MTLKTYDPSQHDIIFAGRLIEGRGEDTFVSVEFDSDLFEKTVGVDGVVVRSKIHDDSAQITITTMQTSEINDTLTELYTSDRNSPNGAGVGDLRIVDRSGTTVFEASKCYIAARPSVEFGRTVGEYEWMLHAADMVMTYGSVSDN